jgi:hypothetical protein
MGGEAGRMNGKQIDVALRLLSLIVTLLTMWVLWESHQLHQLELADKRRHRR